VAAGITVDEFEGGLRPGQYGFTQDPDSHAVRLHWSVRDDQGNGYAPASDQSQGGTT
jgi:hypothetical protein